MKMRLTAFFLMLSVLCACTACRVRVDFSGEVKAGEETTPATTTTTAPPAGNDEMAAEAWQVYSRALELEAAYTTYELVYKGRLSMMGEERVTNARLVRVEEEGSVTLLLQSEVGAKASSGYLKDGIGYFFIDGEKYWMPTDEDTFFETMGFTASTPPAEEMFSGAIVLRGADGSTTVSCPLEEPYAADYARATLGENVVFGSTATRAQVGVTVDAEGHPLTFTSAVTVYSGFAGSISSENENRYTALGEAVVLTPPADLDSYSSIID